MIFLNDFFDKIYCINLARREDRWQHANEQFLKHGLDVERFDATDWKEIESKSNLRPGELANCKSFRNVLQSAKDNNYNQILVLEDDVIFDDRLNLLFDLFIKQIPEDWQMLYFGGNHSSANLIKVSENISKTDYTLALHACGFKLDAIDFLLEKSEPEDKPIDVFCAESHKELNAYVFTPSLATQIQDYSDIQNRIVNYKGMLS